MALDTGDQELAAKCLRGDQEAWWKLFKKYYPLARAIALRLPFRLDLHAAEDIAQEVMMELCRKLLMIQNIRGWVGMVAHNKCVDRLRKKTKEVPMSALRKDGGADFAEGMPAPEPIPIEATDNKGIQKLHQAVGDLGEQCRTLLKQRYFEELSYKDISADASIPVDQLGVYLARCLAKLRKQLSNTPGLWKQLEELL